MILHEVVLHNFGGYRGRHVVPLTPVSPDRPIVLFGGLNGAGKTTFLDALQLALYGRRAAPVVASAAPYEEYLRSCINRDCAEREGAAIELQFSAAIAGQQRDLRVHRSWRRSGKSIRERVEVSEGGQPDATMSDQWAEFVEELIPLQVSSLFFFDGEKIEALADPLRSAGVIGSAVESLLGLSLLDRLATDLVAVERRQKRESAAEGVRAALSAQESELIALKARREDSAQLAAARQNDVDRAQRALDDAEAAFRRDGGDLYERKLDLERRRQHSVSRLREIDLHLIELAASSMPLRLVSSMVDRLLQTVDEDEKTYAAQVMSKRLEQRDREILALASVDVPAVSLKVIESLMSSDRQRLAELAMRPPVASLSDSGRARLAFVWPLEVDRAMTEAEKFLAERASVVAAIDDLDGSLAAVPSGEAIAQAQIAREVAAANLISAVARQELATEALLDVDRRLAAAESDIARRYDEVSGMLAAEADAQRMVLHAGRVRETLRSYRAALLEKHLSKIEAAVLDSFRQLLRKQNLVSDLRLDPGTFALTLFDRDGQPLPSERLSAGERQLLAVALLWGLARVSGKSLPAVIDTPLGRLDGSHRDLLIERYFPVASHQVILLSTDKEIDPELLRQLEPAIGRRYELMHDEGERTTSVRSGYFWETPNVA